MSKGKKNAYDCQSCRFVYVTIDVDDGVTPFMMRCRKPGGGCKGIMQSRFYHESVQGMTPAGEWYRPTEKAELVGLSRYELDHVEQGGLILRDIRVASQSG